MRHLSKLHHNANLRLIAHTYNGLLKPRISRFLQIIFREEHAIVKRLLAEDIGSRILGIIAEILDSLIVERKEHVAPFLIFRAAYCTLRNLPFYNLIAINIHVLRVAWAGLVHVQPRLKRIGILLVLCGLMEERGVHHTIFRNDFGFFLYNRFSGCFLFGLSCPAHHRESCTYNQNNQCFSFHKYRYYKLIFVGYFKHTNFMPIIAFA